METGRFDWGWMAEEGEEIYVAFRKEVGIRKCYELAETTSAAADRCRGDTSSPRLARGCEHVHLHRRDLRRP